MLALSLLTLREPHFWLRILHPVVYCRIDHHEIAMSLPPPWPFYLEIFVLSRNWRAVDLVFSHVGCRSIPTTTLDHSVFISL